MLGNFRGGGGGGGGGEAQGAPVLILDCGESTVGRGPTKQAHLLVKEKKNHKFNHWEVCFDGNINVYKCIQ